MKLEQDLIVQMDGPKFGILLELLSRIVFFANKEAKEECFGQISCVDAALLGPFRVLEDVKLTMKAYK